MNENIKEIEVVATVELTYVFRGSELEELRQEGSLPGSPEELEELKKSFAEQIRKEAETWLDPDHVGIPLIQYFEKEEDGPEDEDAPETEESDG